jgi:hypothetical protein
MLVEAIDDETAIGNEATVGGLCAGLLFVDARASLASLLDALLARPLVSRASTLVMELLREYPDLSRVVLLERIDAGGRSDQLIASLCRLDAQASVPATAEAIKRLYLESGIDQHGSVGFGELVRRFRSYYPDDPHAWDLMVAKWARYGDAGGPIPEVRIARALEMVARHGPEFAQYVLAGDRRSVADAGMVGALRHWWSRNTADSALGHLLESRLDQCDNDITSPWMELATDIVRGGSSPARDVLSFCAFNTLATQWWTLRVRELLLENPSDPEFDEWVDKLALLREPVDTWLVWVRLARQYDCERVDQRLWRCLIEELEFASRPSAVLEKGAALMAFWRSETTRSSFAGALLGRDAAGEPLDSLLKG